MYHTMFCNNLTLFLSKRLSFCYLFLCGAQNMTIELDLPISAPADAFE
jgi:hypothetical protein